jgi:small GTP-binding protein
MPINLKMVAVGFDGSGKTSMYHTFAKKKFPAEYVPTVFEGFAHNFEIDGNYVNLAFWDIACGENDEYARLRPLSYDRADVFVLCYDISNVNLYHRIKEFWVDNELRSFDPKIPIILVATKIDLREGELKTVSREEGESLAAEIDAAGYFEISSLRMEGLDELFHQICVVGMNPMNYQKKTPKNKCLIS